MDLVLPDTLIVVADKGYAQRLRQLAMVVRYTPTRVLVRKWYDRSRRWGALVGVQRRHIVEVAGDTAATRRAREAWPPIEEG